MVQHIRRLAWLALTGLSSVSFANACSDRGWTSETEASSGSLGLALQLDPELGLTTVHFELAGPNGYSLAGDIDVGSSARIYRAFERLPAGSYAVTLSATGQGGTPTCSGRADFIVRAHATTSVTVNLQCRIAGRTGSVAINGSLNVCPTIDSLAALPQTLVVGETSRLSALASDVDHAPQTLAYAWHATLGTLSNENVANPTFTAREPGNATLTLTASDGDCSDEWTVDVLVLPAPQTTAPPSGTPSTHGGENSANDDSDLEPSSSTAETVTSTSATTSGSTTSGTSVGPTDPTSGTPGTSNTAPVSTTSAETTQATSSPDADPSSVSSDWGSTETSGLDSSIDSETSSGPVFVPPALVGTAVGIRASASTSITVTVPSTVQVGDLAVAFLLATGTSHTVASAPTGFTTRDLAAINHRLSHGQVTSADALTWSLSGSATTSATVFFFRGRDLGVFVSATSSASGANFDVAGATTAPVVTGPQTGFALFGIQLPLSGTPTITAGPGGSWVSPPTTDGVQLFSWYQPYAWGHVGAPGFALPSIAGSTLSASATKRTAQVVVFGPAL